MVNQYEAIIRSLINLGGEGTIKEVKEWLEQHYPNSWKDTGTTLADMVPVSHGGNLSSTVRDEYRVLERFSRGHYHLLADASNENAGM